MLVFLLLLPFHAGWAKGLLNLKCTIKHRDGGEAPLYFVIDFDKTEIRNTQGIAFRNPIINEQNFTFESIKNPPDIKNIIYRIDRSSGRLHIISYHISGLININGICKKSSGKKKF